MASEAPAVAGLVNFGNTCYANALLQALASCESYFDYTQLLSKTFTVPLEFAKATEREGKDWRTALPVARSVANCLERLQPSYRRQPLVASALEVLHGVGQHDRRLFRGFGEQQDVSEVLDCIVAASRVELRAWGRQYLRNRCALQLKETDDASYSSSCKPNSSHILRNTGNGPRPPLPSEVHSLTVHQFQSMDGFDGLLSHHLECCRCGHTFDIQLNAFTSLLLPIPNLQLDLSTDVTLESCLHDFFTTKRQGPIRCPKCSLCCTLSSGTERRSSFSHKLRSSMSSSNPSSCDEDINNGNKMCHGLGHLLKDEKEEAFQGVIFRNHASFDYTEFQNNTLRPLELDPESKEAVVKEVSALARSPSFREAGVDRWALKLRKFGIPWVHAESHVHATTAIAKCPKVLVISLQRKIFDGTSYRKIQGLVRFPLYLNLSSFMSRSSVHGSSYRLKALLCHQGNENSGHYYTVRSIPTPDGLSYRWMLVSDDRVCPVGENAVLNLEASMLFYERAAEPVMPFSAVSSFVSLYDA